MDKNKYDKLDKLFQSRLKNDKLVQEEWNTPPASIFDEAMSEMNKKKRIRRFLFWITASIFLVGFIVFTINNLNRINELENTIANLQSVENLTFASPVKEQVENEQESIGEHEVLEQTNQNIPQTEIETAQKGLINSSKEKTQAITIIHKKSDKETQHYENPKEVSTPVLSTDINLPNAVANHKRIKQSFPVPITNKGILNRAEHLSIPENIVLTDKETKANKNPFLAYLISGVNATTIRMTNTEDASFSLTEYEKYYSDIFAGLGIEYQLSPKWAIDANASYNRMHVNSVFENDIVYDQSKEYTNNQGIRYYEDDYDVYSVLGRFTGDLNFDLDQSQPDDKDKMSNITSIDNSFKTFSLSLGGLYTPYEKNNFSMSVGVGLSYHHLLEIKEEMEATISHENELMLRESIEVDAMKHANRNYLSPYINLRLGYAINSNLGFKLDLSSSHSITSIRKTTMETDPKTYINNLRSGILFYVKF